MIAISYVLHAGSVLLLILLARSLRHRAATEAAMGNVLASTARLNAGTATGEILAREVQKHLNVSASCKLVAGFASWAFLINSALLLWRLHAW